MLNNQTQTTDSVRKLMEELQRRVREAEQAEAQKKGVQKQNKS